MSEKKERGKFNKIMCAVWTGIETTVRVTSVLVFVAIFISILVLLTSGDDVDLEDSTALVLAPRGVLVEQLSGADPVEQAMAEITGGAQAETLLRDLTDVIDMAAEDDRIPVMVLRLDSLSGGGLTKLQDLRESIEGFKAAGKKVIAIANGYDRTSYYLASLADEVYMHPMGLMMLEGFSRYRMYYKEGIDKLGLDWNVFKVGEYKSAVEPYLRNGMSDEAKEANLEWMGDLWRVYLEDVAGARGIEVEKLEEYIDNQTHLIEVAQGSSAHAAKNAGLIDEAWYPDELKAHLIELVGSDDDNESYRSISGSDYLKVIGDDRPSLGGDGDVIGVLVARGTILDGSHPPGTIGGDSTAALIRKARQDDDVKALVLRVDSGGGSAFASEVIRRELELARGDGLPVVVSMGTVAASGGYWISTSCDKLVASPTTITGSIGIFGMFPTYHRPLANHLGIRVDGVATTTYAGAIRPDRELPQEIGHAIQQVINRGYRDFLERVAKARDMSEEDVDKIARGRVWSGEDAYKLGLIDEMGDLDDALAAAAELAGIEDDYSIRFLEKELGFKEQLISELFAIAGFNRSDTSNRSANMAPQPELARVLAKQAKTLLELNDPVGMYAHSMIEND
jgi:protease-4